MQKTYDDEVRAPAAAPTVTSQKSGGIVMGGGLGRPKRVVSEDGAELQVGLLTGHKIRCMPCASAAGDEVPLDVEFSHVKLAILQLRLQERHRSAGAGDFGMRESKLAGATLGKVKKLTLAVGGATHLVAQQDGKLEIVLPKEAVPVPGVVTISMEYESAVLGSTTAKDADWFAGDYEAKFVFGGQQSAGCCVIS
jgi:hypothetical protein